MKDNEIKKALECCTKGLSCKECPANPHKGNYGYCTGLLLKDTLDLINRLQSELFKEQNKNKKLRNERNHLKAENENLSHNNKEMTKSILANHKALKQAKAEAYKEFAEMVKKEIIEAKYQYIQSPYSRACNQVADWCVNLCDNLLKEKVGEDNA